MAFRFDFNEPADRWAYARGRERLVMDRVAAGAIVIAFSGAAPQVIRFDNPNESLFFQCNIETELERTGWTMTGFESGMAEARPLARFSG